MGNHRADSTAPRTSAGDSTPTAGSTYVGKRVARQPQAEKPSTYVGKRVAVTSDVVVPTIAAVETPVVVSPVIEQVSPALPNPYAARPFERTPTVELPALRDIPLADPMSDSSTQLRAIQASGKRRAVRHAGTRGPLFRGLPTLPVAAGVATIAVAVGGVMTSANPQLAAAAGDRLNSPNAMTGSFGDAVVGARAATISRDSDRDALSQAAGADLVAAAEKSAAERTSAMTTLAAKATKESAKIALNAWVLPISSGGYRLTARFGEYGLWSNYHTGLDFAAPTGTPIMAIANGVVTSASYDGAYGNKTVVTLDDGTELWFCHQSAFKVSTGDKVRAGELIGYVGGTGHVTGPHLHVEVRPGGGDPVDPFAAFQQHSVTP